VTTTSGTARRAAVEDLGAAVRSLVHAVVDTEVDDETMARASALAREAAALLSAAVRPAHRLSPPHLRRAGYRAYSPVSGPGNPVSPPARVVLADPSSGRVEMECTLHRVHEGPPTYGHGGMSAMLLDQVLGTVAALTGRTGLTRSLELSYRGPVPLGEPLRLVGRIASHTDTRIETAGAITSAARPGVDLVRATATFLVPRPDQLNRLFGHVESGGDPIPSGD
jgi:acyl-coenzyme A thioesterase PaaI-like protein